VRLISNNPEKILMLEGAGLEVVERVSTKSKTVVAGVAKF